MKILSKSERQQIATTNLSDTDFKDFMNLYIKKALETHILS